MGNVKRYLEDLSDEIGYGGSINAEVMAEATRLINIDIARGVITSHFKGIAYSNYQLIDGKEWDGDCGDSSLLILIHEDMVKGRKRALQIDTELAESLGKCKMYIEHYVEDKPRRGISLWYSAIYLEPILD